MTVLPSRGEKEGSLPNSVTEWYVAADPACKYNKMNLLNSYSTDPQ